MKLLTATIAWGHERFQNWSVLSVSSFVEGKIPRWERRTPARILDVLSAVAGPLGDLVRPGINWLLWDHKATAGSLEPFYCLLGERLQANTNPVGRCGLEKCVELTDNGRWKRYAVWLLFPVQCKLDTVGPVEISFCVWSLSRNISLCKKLISSLSESIVLKLYASRATFN